MTTPPLSLSSNNSLEKDEEEALDIFSMPIPNASLISRQETDKEANPTNQSIPSIDNPHSNNSNLSNNSTSDDDNPCAIPSLTNLSAGLLTRQITDDTPHSKNPRAQTDNKDGNAVSDDEQKINLQPFKLSRQITDDTPHSKNPPQNDENEEQINVTPFKLSRQVTDDTPHSKNTQEAIFSNYNLPPMNITRQTTDDVKPNVKPDIEKQITDTVQNVNVNVIVRDSDNTGIGFNLPPMNITRQTTDDAKDIDNDTGLDDVNFNLPPMNITRQTTDDAKDIDAQNEQVNTNTAAVTMDALNMGFNLPPMNISRQVTDIKDTENENENDVGLDTLDMPLQISRQQTDQTDKGNDNNNNLSPLPDMNSNDLLLTPLIRQQTDQTDKEYNNEQFEFNGDDDVSNSNNLTENNLDNFNDSAGLPTLDTISRQTTDMTANDDNDMDMNMMIDQMDVSNENVIKQIPSKVNDNLNNQYLDTDLLMFDDSGQLLNNKAGDLGIENVENIEQIEDDSINQFIEHNQPIICMHFNPKKDKQYQIVTGGQDEKAYIWDIMNYDSSQSYSEQKSNNNYISLSDHTDTIIDCLYNSTGKFLATASMDSTIKIYNSKNNEYKLISSFDIENEISFIEWNGSNNKNKRNVLMCGSFDKNVWIYKYNKEIKTFENTQILSGHSSKIECGGWCKYDNNIAYSGDSDGMIIIWDNIINDMPFSGKKKYIFKPNKNLHTIYHESSINVIDNCISAPLLISGSTDYSVCLLNYENGKILSKLGSHSDSVECVKFNKLYNPQIKYTNYVSSSSLDGMINIWDLNNGKIRNVLKHESSVIVHEWFNTEMNSNLIVSGCMNGIIYIWDSRNGEIINQFKGHQKDNTIQCIKITMDDKYIVSGCDDSSVRVWKL